MFFVFSSVLRFVGPTDNIYSCSFVQMLEQRLENAFEEAQDKVLETYNRLTVEVLHFRLFLVQNADSQLWHICMRHANRANVNNNAQSDILDTHTTIHFLHGCYIMDTLRHCASALLQLTHKTQKMVL